MINAQVEGALRNLIHSVEHEGYCGSECRVGESLENAKRVLKKVDKN